MNVIFGSAGFAKEVDFLLNDIFIKSAEDLRPSYFIAEESNPLVGTEINSKLVLSESDFFAKFKNKEVNCVIAVGNPIIRKKIYEKIKTKLNKAFFLNIIHPSVVFDTRNNKIKMGIGNILCAGSILTTDIIIKDFALINLNCTIGHDVEIASFTTLSPGVHISGNVKVGENVFLGTGAVVSENVSIISNTIIGAGAVVVKNINEPGTYIGIPAKMVENR